MADLLFRCRVAADSYPQALHPLQSRTFRPDNAVLCVRVKSLLYAILDRRSLKLNEINLRYTRAERGILPD
jgi:hypothetical protein